MINVKSNQPRNVFATAVILLSTSLTLTACQQPNPTDELKSQGKTSQQVDGETSWGGGEGPSYTPSPQLPASFPIAEVPLAEGNVVDAGERAAGRWFVNVEVTAPTDISSAIDTLRSAGFTLVSQSETGSGSAAELNGPTYEVMLLSIASESGELLSYEVSSAS